MKPTQNANAALNEQLAADLDRCIKIDKSLKSVTKAQLYPHLPNAAVAHFTFEGGQILPGRYVRSGEIVRIDDKRIDKLIKTTNVVEINTGDVVAAAIVYGVLGKSNVAAKAMMADLAKPKPVAEETEEVA